MKVALVIGARPQFIKAAPLVRELRARTDLEVLLIHSGQHFDDNMSAVFFRELELPEPDCHLGVHSGNHGEMTGRMLTGIEAYLLREQVDRVVVFGDTNTTLAGALAATKLRLACAHVEAGLRSWNRTMPEEVNRVLVDHCSTWLFCPTEQAVRNLAAEGIHRGVHLVGDIMFDAVRMFLPKAKERVGSLASRALSSGEYYVLTTHRAYNTEDVCNLQNIFTACAQLPAKVLFPVHPRTRPLLAQNVTVPANVVLCDPLGYLDMLCVVANSQCVLTDSGGLQKEAYFLGVPCVTLRPETEWVETVRAGWNIVAGVETEGILAAIRSIRHSVRMPIACFGNGHSAPKMCRVITNELQVEHASPSPVS